jgi:hypothetical protein
MAWHIVRDVLITIHLREASGKRIHILHSQMSSLDYLTEPAHNCTKDDVNDEAFIHVTTTIGCCDVVGAYLAYGVWPLSATWDLGKVEEVEVPLLKVIVHVPKVSAVKGSKEKDHEFATSVSVGANKLVGSYDLIKHRACMSQIQNSHLNRVFEVAGVMYSPRPMLEARGIGGSKK